MKQTDIDGLERILRRLGAENAEPPEGLAERALLCIVAELSRRRSRQRRVWQRRVWTHLALAGALSLPVLVALNAATLWLLASGLALWLPAPLVGAVAFFVGGLMLLALSLTYGSLPILASFASRFREDLL
jgi:hypothetical protein